MQIAASLAPRAFAKIACGFAHVDQFFNRVSRQILRAAENASEYCNTRRVFKRLQSIESLPQVRTISDGAVVSHQQRIVMFDQWPHRFRSEEHTSELQSHVNLVCRLLLEKKKKK